MEDHVELLLLCADVLDYPRHVGRVRALSYRHGVVPGKHLVHLAQELGHARSVAVLVPSKLPLAPRVCDWCIHHLALAIHVDGIDSEPVHTALEPEFHGRLVDGLARDGILPIEIRLLGTEQVQVVFLCELVPLPDRTHEVAEPVVGWAALPVDVACGAPDVPVTFGVVL